MKPEDFPYLDRVQFNLGLHFQTPWNERTICPLICCLLTCQKYNEVMRMPERLQTERLVLRKPVMGEARAIFEDWAQDEEVACYLTWCPHRQIAETREFVQHCLAAWAV